MRLSSDPLPAPYDSVKPLRPFVDHGWYSNAKQLHALIDQHHVKIIVEVGAWLGKSTMDLARYLPQDGLVYAIDHWLGSIEHQPGHEHWHAFLPYLYEQFLSNVIHRGLTHKIIPLRMPSLEAAQILDVQPDLIYIDASHETEAVYQDLCAWYPFVKDKGVLCGDDWGWPSVRKAVELFAKQNGLRIICSGNFWELAPSHKNFQELKQVR
jgi:hypothetical protein